MSNALLRAAAKRHRMVASTLTDPRDRAIINHYADEVESLERLLVTPSDRSAGGHAARKRWMLADSLARTYHPEPTAKFDHLLNSLDGAANA